MTRMGIYDQLETAFQDLVAPALHELRGQIEGLRADIRRVDGKVDSVQAQMGSMKNELVAIDIRERLAALETRRA